jgi:molybdenum cofactor cytidylyltransferase
MSPQRAVGLVLAAGRGGRIGHPKALLEYDSGKSFLDIISAAIRKGGAEVKVVLGFEADAVRARHPELDFVVNEEWEKGGQFSSVLRGLESVLEDGCDRVMVHPVDMPAVRASTFAALIKANFSKDGAVPEFEGATGHPLVLSANAAKNVVGMKNVPHLEAAQKALQIERVKVRDPGVVVNFNTPEIYERLLGSAPHPAPPRKKGGRQKKTA